MRKYHRTTREEIFVLPKTKLSNTSNHFIHKQNFYCHNSNDDDNDNEYYMFNEVYRVYNFVDKST